MDSFMFIIIVLNLRKKDISEKDPYLKLARFEIENT